MDKHPARELLLKVTRKYPNIWKHVNELLEEKENLQWPDWCFLPLDAWLALARYTMSEPNFHEAAGFELNSEIEQLKLGNVFAALGTWRMTQGIYRFDETLYGELINTPVNGKIPVDVLLNLPEWCIFVETPNFAYDDLSLQGFWAFLEFDQKEKRKELRFLLLADDGQTIPSILHLEQADLESAVSSVHKQAQKQIEELGDDAISYKERINEMVDATVYFLSRALSLLLYICSQNDFTHNQYPDIKPSMPEPKKTNKGIRYFPASIPTTWGVGVRMGTALRRVSAQTQSGQGDSLGQEVKRPHIRRGHWHTFLTGPRKTKDGADIPAARRARVLRWIPPVAVNVSDLKELEALPSVIRPVK